MKLFGLFGSKGAVRQEPLEDQLAPIKRNPALASLPLRPSCDSLPDSHGIFGEEPTNPIPVAGHTGERTYLNSLRSANDCSYLYHRSHTVPSPLFEGLLDVYELVSTDGGDWRTLFFSMMHPRRSTLAPAGMRLIAWPKSPTDQVFTRIAGFGVTMKVDPFPEGLPDAVRGYPALQQIGVADAHAQIIQDIIEKRAGLWQRPDA